MATLEPAIARPSVIALPALSAARPALQVRLGWASAAAAGKINEDCYAVVAPTNPEELRRGIVMAVAGGVSGGEAARLVAQATLHGLVRDYYATPEAWSVGRALDRLLRASNDWLWSQNARWPEQDATVIAMSLIVLRDHHYYLAHVGDTRVYRARGKVFKQLTVDHTWQRNDMRHVLRRAVGLDSHLVVDFADGELQAGDIFVLVTDGVWEVLGDRAMSELVRGGSDPEATAQALVGSAHEHQAAYMGRNDSTAVVFEVEPRSEPA
jgi:serine/threonine protein phosphatase PrpC